MQLENPIKRGRGRPRKTPLPNIPNGDEKMSNKLVDQTDIAQVVNDYLDKGIRALPATKVPKITIKQGKGDEEVACLVISDIQIGHLTPSTNTEIIGKRMENLITRFLKIVDIHRKAYPIKKVKVFILGDLIQSEDIGFKVSLNELDGTLMNQMFEGAIPMLEKALLSLLPHFPGGVEVHTISGNHGRLDRFHSETTNWDTIIYRFLQARLANYPQIKWEVEGEKFYQKVKIWDKTFLLVHGDQIKMFMNIPFYGVTQRAMRWQGSLPGDKFSYMVLGHFHTISEFQWNDIQVFINGCFVTEDQWVLKGLGMQSSASQWAFGVHPRKGVSWRYQIQLD